MSNIRIIPCLDVDNGRVVKGVNFVDLTSKARAIEFVYLSQLLFKKLSFLIAAVPRIILSAPISTNFLILSSFLIPPPT